MKSKRLAISMVALLLMGVHTQPMKAEGQMKTEVKVGQVTAGYRVARPTRNLDAVIRFYVKGLGLDVLYQFEAHDGFDGVMIGDKILNYHLEFTVQVGHTAPKAPSKDNLMVFYIPDTPAYENMVKRMKHNGFELVKSLNPYWDNGGVTFEDPDHYRVVLFNGQVPF